MQARGEHAFGILAEVGLAKGVRGEVSGLRCKFQALRSKVKVEIRDLRATLEKNYNDLLRILADHDHRIARLEDKK